MQLSRIHNGENLDIKNIVRQKSIRLTNARKEILDIFSIATKPLSYEEVKDDITMDKATFYRNITKFENEKIINSFESSDKKRYYEIKQLPHPHFICSKCHKVECIKKELEFALEGYVIENIILKGKCSACNK